MKKVVLDAEMKKQLAEEVARLRRQISTDSSSLDSVALLRFLDVVEQYLAHSEVVVPVGVHTMQSFLNERHPELAEKLKKQEEGREE